MSYIPQMHRYRIVAQISLILSILNLVVAAPTVVHEIHEARSDEMVVAEDAAAIPKKLRGLEAASTRSTDPPSSLDAMASPQHSSDGSTSSGYSAPYLSSDESVSGYSWFLDRPPRLSLSGHLPASLHEPASPRPSSSGSSEMTLPEWTPPSPPPHFIALLQGLLSPHPSSSGSSEIAIPEWLQWLAPVMPPSPHPSSSGSSESEIPSSLQLTGSDLATTETYSTSDRFTPSHYSSSLLSSTDPFSHLSDEPMYAPHSLASGGSVSTLHSLTSDESMSTVHSLTSDGLMSTLHSLTSDGSMSIPYSLMSGGSMSTPYSSASGGPLSSHYFSASDGLGSPSTPSPDNADFFNKKLMKKLKIVVGVAIVGGIITHNN